MKHGGCHPSSAPASRIHEPHCIFLAVVTSELTVQSRLRCIAKWNHHTVVDMYKQQPVVCAFSLQQCTASLYTSEVSMSGLSYWVLSQCALMGDP